MAITTRNYIRGVPQTVVLAQMEQSDGSNQHVRRDGILVNGFSDLVLYADSGGASPLPLTSYNSTTVDADWTADESGFTGKTVYSQYQITDATYQGVDIWANFSDFGTYTDNDAPYLRVGVQTLITASGTLSPSIGATCEMVTVDTSLGNIALTIEAPVFVGQCMDIICDGTGYVDVTFPGQESTAAVRVTNGKKLSLKGKSGGDWIADDGICGVLVNGNFNTTFHTSNRMEISGNHAKDNGLTTNQTYLYPYAFTAFDDFQISGVEDGASFGTLIYGANETTAQFEVFNLSISTGALNNLNRSFYNRTKGAY